MKKVILTAIGVLVFMGMAYGFSITTGAITVGSTAQYISTISADAFKGVFTVEAGSVRVRWDGTAPEAQYGHVLNSGDVLTLYDRADIAKFKVILNSGSSGATVTYTLQAKD
jgi:hypothetical protein